jgi:hypothetical protein
MLEVVATIKNPAEGQNSIVATSYFRQQVVPTKPPKSLHVFHCLDQLSLLTQIVSPFMVFLMISIV